MMLVAGDHLDHLHSHLCQQDLYDNQEVSAIVYVVPLKWTLTTETPKTLSFMMLRKLMES